ncbi:MAG: hypothetical protein A3G34_09770 [Candidatus Lindowbacteria bacterium RIFCSPLOWO2_12_FULL_62_27]|nr:MAG: hypothetical protein A3G34_09770 [Candidatus Lindowbacteria bacterium RIFCSPLOWO2_12_FULL_62_27]
MFLLLSLTCYPLPSYAQQSEEEARVGMVESVEEMRYTEELTATAFRARRDKLGWLFDYGYTAGFSYTAAEEGDRDRTSQDDPDHTWDHEFNIFGAVASVDRKAKVYARAKTVYTDNAKISPTTRESDVDQPKIDMMYYERVFKGQRLKHTLTVGRQFYKFGRGIAYGLTADGFLWESKGRKMQINAMFSRQKPGDNNIDNLAPGSGRTKRWFFGGEYKHKFKGWLKLDVFGLMNIDRNTEEAYAPAAGLVQRSQFDSRYFGLGLDGTFFSKLNYWWEYIVVQGKTYNAALAAAAASKVSVNADALDFGLRYLFGGDLAPTLFTEYAFGSGDADRGNNVTSSSFGSQFGKDSVFRSFGGLPMGHALAPSLANIRIGKIGGSVQPFGRMASARWNDMTLNLTAYTYWADAPGGPTSDGGKIFPTVASEASDDVGDEYDLTVSWKFFNDVNYQLKWGVFMPGPAYGGNRAHEEYMKLKVSFDL